MAEGQAPPVSGEANPGQFGEDGDKKWVNEVIAHEEQIRQFRRIIFWVALVVCAILYFLFFRALWMLHHNSDALEMFVEHKHLLALLLSLLFVPSLMLWGILRAAFKLTATPESAEVVKTIVSSHPLG